MHTKIVTENFERTFKTSPEIVCHAPGRVNLIGEHTDYNDGFVLPAAINFGTTIAASKRDDSVFDVYAIDYDMQRNAFDLTSIEFDKHMMWSNYIRGVVKMLFASYPQIKGANLVVTGNVPQGAGLSSSASFEVAIVKTIASLYQLDIDGVKAALIGQKAENKFVGCNCGIMDQLVSAMGQEKSAMLLDCRSLTFSDAPIPQDFSLFIVNSNVKRGLVDSEYNLRREQCEQAAQFFKKPALRDVTVEQLESAKDTLDDVIYRRAKHIVTENDRTLAMLDALKEHDIAKVSGLMKASHVSMRDDFEITTWQIDKLVEIIDAELGLAGGVRMTGGGFGGCVVALVPTRLVGKLTEIVEQAYPIATGLQPSIYNCVAVNGAFR